MEIRKYIRRINWRAAKAVGLLLMILLWWMTPVIASVLPERIECGMECCLNDGHCCCVTRFEPSDENHNSHRNASFTEAEITRSCPSNCAAPSIGPQMIRHLIHRPLIFGKAAADPPLPFETRISHHLHSSAADPSSPRAPPSVTDR